MTQLHPWRPPAPEPLAVAATFSTSQEALLARGYLEAHGIEVFLADEHTVRMDWLYSNAIGGVKLKVWFSDLPRARNLLDQPAGQGDDAATHGWGACPGCDSSRLEIVTDKRPAFVSWLLLGLPLFPARTRLKCADCGRESGYPAG